MCEHCSNFSPPSRRDVLKAGAAALGAAALGALGGCAEAGHTDLPDVYQDHIVQESGGARVKIDPKKVVVPPPVPAQASEYGSIMPRAAWTAVPLALRKGLEMNGVNKITIHHSGDGKPFMGNTTAEVARHLPILYNGAIHSHPEVRHWRGRHLIAEGDAPLELDGEVVGTLPLEVDVLPSALSITCRAVVSRPR